MSWERLTLDDLKTALNPVELKSYSEDHADLDVPARAQGILDDVVQQVRGDIASHHLNLMSVEDDLIPKAYHSNALAVARYRLLSTLPYCEVSLSREKEWEAAVKFFDSVARGVRRPEKAANARGNDAAAEEPLPGAQVVSSRPKLTGRENLSGL